MAMEPSELENEENERAELAHLTGRSSSTKPFPCGPSWLRWGAGLLIALAAAALFLAAVAQSQEGQEAMPQRELLVPRIQCQHASCDRFSAPLKFGHCDGPANSDDCQQSCCGEIDCDSISGWSCSAELGPEFLKRDVPWNRKGMHMNTMACQGEDDCKDKCCQSTCANTVCQAPYLCKKPYAPEKCTPSQCQSQCCYDAGYCGSSLNAWSLACEQCKSKVEWCEDKLSTPRSSVSRDEWNDLVVAKVQDGLLAPGCEEDDTPDCRTKYKYYLLSTFELHKSQEGISANTVHVVPGGTVALSGGDDYQVFKWRISDGGFLRNYSTHRSPVHQVYAMNDAAFFCAATRTEAIIWLVNSGSDYSDSVEMVFTPEEPRKGMDPNVEVTGCIGLNTYEKVVIGLSNSFSILWEFENAHFLPVPLDPKLEYRWQIRKDFGYYKRWPKWDKQHILKTTLRQWWRDNFGLKKDYIRRLRGANMTADQRKLGTPHVSISKGSIPWLYKKLKRSDKSAPWVNTFSNIHWGKVPSYYYKPKDWGAVTALVQIPSDLLFAAGYEDGSIRVWTTDSGYIKVVIPKAHAGAISVMIPAPAGNKFFSAGHDGFIKVWSASSLSLLDTIYSGFAGPVSSLAMIPGGNAIYSGHYSGKFYLWELGGDSALCQLDTHGGKINSLAVNPGSIGQVLTALENGDVRTYVQR